MIAVNYDGVDGTRTEFKTMIEQAGKIEGYIIKEYGGRISPMDLLWVGALWAF